MAQGPGFHTRAVRVLKVGLPLAAFGLLASLFLFDTDSRSPGALEFAEGDVAALGSGLRVTQPVFSGATDSGAPFRFSADLVIPDAAPPRRVAIEGLTGTLTLPEGAMEVRGQRGELDLQARTLTLEGMVEVRTPDGTIAAAPRLMADLAQGRVVGLGGVRAEGPAGTIAAQQFTVDVIDGRPGAISFGGGVSLVYNPGPEAGE